MIEKKNPLFDCMLELADRLFRMNIPHNLFQDHDGWTIVLYQSTGVVYGKQALMFSFYTGSKGWEEDLIEVFKGDETISSYREKGTLNEHWYTADIETCYETIMEWYMRRYNDIYDNDN